MKSVIKSIVASILIFESKLVLKKYKPKIISITGSVGKTSTKEAVFAVLSKSTYVRKTDKSYNSQLGLALTILGIPSGDQSPAKWFLNIFSGLWLLMSKRSYPEWLVFEVGVGKPGQMQKAISWLKSDVVVITAIPKVPVHIEFFNSRKALIEEKASLINTLKKNGLLILNADDSTVLDLKSRTKAMTLSYGFSKEADLVASEMNILYEESHPKGMTFRIDGDGSSLPVVIEGVVGINHVYGALVALSCAKNLQLNILESIDALKNFDTPHGRMKILSGAEGTTIIDDSYNSSPQAASAALSVLDRIDTSGRKLAVLGDMLELGKHTEESHFNLGVEAKKIVDVLVLVGPRAKFIAEGAFSVKMPKKNVFVFSNIKEASIFLKEFIKPKDLILIKGSQKMRMENIVASLLADPNMKKNLARQEPEWSLRY